MRLEGTRFGEIELDGANIVDVPAGLIGFPDEKRFVLLQPQPGKTVAWLQSLSTPSLAFPVVDGGEIDDYPDPSPELLAEAAALTNGELAVLVIVSARQAQDGLIANMLAPIVVDVTSKRAAQVVLDSKRYSAMAPLARRAAARS